MNKIYIQLQKQWSKARKIAMLAIAAVGMMSCSDESLTGNENPIGNSPAEMEATVEKTNVRSNLGTRAAFKKDMSAIVWTKGDKIDIYTSKSRFVAYTVGDNDAGKTHGKFTGALDSDESIAGQAVYPNGLASNYSSNTSMTITLPDSYEYNEADGALGDYQNSARMPMYSKFAGSNIFFRHLGGYFILELQYIPVGAAKMVFTVNKRITGNFNVDLTQSYPTYNTDDTDAGKTVTITFPTTTALCNKVFYIPVPVGTGYEVTWDIQNSAGVSLLNSSITEDGSYDIERTTVQVISKQVSTVGTTYSGDMRTAGDIVSAMTIGWNLGNTMEAGNDQQEESNMGLETITSWRNPVPTQALIDEIDNAGFNTIRIPVRWMNHADENGKIKEEWMAKVKEVVDMAYTKGLFVILNSHHDKWYDRPAQHSETSSAQKRARFMKMWGQIANKFKDYDDKLIFAGVNEILWGESWNTPEGKADELLADLVDDFIQVVRSTGGNNLGRSLIFQSYASKAMVNVKRMPTDPVSGRLIYEFHYYTYTYSFHKDTSWQWDNTNPGLAESELDEQLPKVKQTYIDAGYPVIISEMGAEMKVPGKCDKDGTVEVSTADNNRADYHEYVVSRAKAYGIKCIYWDNGYFGADGDDEYFGLINRQTNQFDSRGLKALNGIRKGYGMEEDYAPTYAPAN